VPRIGWCSDGAGDFAETLPPASLSVDVDLTHWTDVRRWGSRGPFVGGLVGGGAGRRVVGNVFFFLVSNLYEGHEMRAGVTFSCARWGGCGAVKR